MQANTMEIPSSTVVESNDFVKSLKESVRNASAEKLAQEDDSNRQKKLEYFTAVKAGMKMIAEMGWNEMTLITWQTWSNCSFSPKNAVDLLEYLGRHIKEGVSDIRFVFDEFSKPEYKDITFHTTRTVKTIGKHYDEEEVIDFKLLVSW